MSLKLRKFPLAVPLVAVLTAVAVLLSACSPGSKKGAPAAGGAFVPPGQLDEYYMFASGGHSGQVFVYGLPSMRRIRTIPVFTPDPATGYGYDERSRQMLGKFTWGDVHHPALSETNGEYDGRWLFVNDNANNRVARIELKTFTTQQILGPIPNVMGPHCAAFITPNSEYFMMPTRFSVPVPVGTYAPLEQYGEKYKGALAAIAIDPKTGEMSLGWELLLPPWNYDLSDAGKKESEGWAFLTTYNTEEATTRLETNSAQNDRDYLVVVNWKAAEAAAREGKAELIDGARVIDPSKVEGIAYLIPVAKSPHGVDVSPDGKYIVASGKLSPTATVYEFAKIRAAVEKKDFSGTVRGLPVLNYESTRVAEVPVGLGPLHTQFDNQGYAYTSLFLDSAIAKWKLGTWEVVDKVPIQYNIGHLAATEGDSASPDGKYLVALNKFAKDRYLSVGPSHPENLQLISLSGSKMQVIAEAPADPEPHYAQIVKADKIKTMEIHPKDEARPGSVWKPENARIERDGNKVHVYMMATRSRFVPDVVEVNQGDRVVFHVTNADLDEDMTHGFGITLYNTNMEMQPGETKVLEIVADKPGVYPFYCTNFCSALHQEMQGYLLVKPRA